MEVKKLTVLIKGAGEIASGIAYHLNRSGYLVCMTEITEPLAVSRATCYSDAVFDGIKTVQDVTAVLTPASLIDIKSSWEKRYIPVIIDPGASIKKQVHPDVLIDARMLKKIADTAISDAPLVLGIGPGFIAGENVHIVVESNDLSGNLGKLIYEGESESNTGRPIVVGGLTTERVVWAPIDGTFSSNLQIGDSVQAGQLAGKIGDTVLRIPLSGHLRGLIRSGVTVTRGTKMLEVDQVNTPASFFIIREKMTIIGEAVVNAIRNYKFDNKADVK